MDRRTTSPGFIRHPTETTRPGDEINAEYMAKKRHGKIYDFFLKCKLRPISNEEAKDLAQEFFAKKILGSNSLRIYSPIRGKLRAYVIVLLKSFLRTYMKKARNWDPQTIEPYLDEVVAPADVQSEANMYLESAKGVLCPRWKKAGKNVEVQLALIGTIATDRSTAHEEAVLKSWAKSEGLPQSSIYELRHQAKEELRKEVEHQIRKDYGNDASALYSVLFPNV